MFDDVLRLQCDAVLEHSNKIFTHHTPAYDDAPSNWVWLEKDRLFRTYSYTSRNTASLYESSLLPWPKDTQPILSQDIPAHDDALTYQLWLPSVWQLRKYNPDEHS